MFRHVARIAALVVPFMCTLEVRGNDSYPDRLKHAHETASAEYPSDAAAYVQRFFHLLAGAPARHPPQLDKGRTSSVDPIYSIEQYVRNARALIQRVVEEHDYEVKIAGGEPDSEFSDAVAVGTERGWPCTGVLIAPNAVLTACHCGTPTRVSVGEVAGEGGAVIEVAEVVAHPRATPTHEHDLSILILKEKVVNASPRPRAVCNAADCTQIRVVGFGKPSSKRRRRYIDVAVAESPCVSHDLFGCFGDYELVAGDHFKLTCKGDSGGPAYRSDRGGWALVGIVSRSSKEYHGSNCPESTVYVRVSDHDEWISEVLGHYAH